MSVTFEAEPDGTISVKVGDGSDLLTHALNDSISSLAPQGAAHPGLSTFWIDRAEGAVRSRAGEPTGAPFASGNVTYLRLDGDRVIAGYEFDKDESEAATIPIEEFLTVLEGWRRQVIEAGGVSGAEALELSPDAQPKPLGPGE